MPTLTKSPPLQRTTSDKSSPVGARRVHRGTPAYELVGPTGAPVVIALGGISATRHVTASDVDPSPGWWQTLVAAGRTIDPARCRILGIDFLDGGRRRDGEPRRTVTTHEQADAVAGVLDRLGLERAYALVGASYGGMVALAFAERYPERVERLVVVSAPHEPHPMSTALRALQRRIVRLGLETDRVGDALAIARGLAMTSYRSAREFAERFDPAPVALRENDATFPVECYLRYQGERFAERWTAARFLALSLSGDLHHVDPEAIRTPTVLVAAEGDAIVPRSQLEALASRLGGPCRLVDLPSLYGHDAFLTEPARLDGILASALSLSELS